MIEKKGDRHLLDGREVSDLCHRHGTPLYVYSAATIRNKFERFHSAFDLQNMKIFYASKALPNVHILAYLRSLGACLDAVSVNEIMLGMRAGFKRDEIMFTPNMVSREDLDLAIQLGVKINIGNLDSLEYVGVHYPGQGICIRINPHIMAGGHSKISVGHIDSKFGISIHQLPAVKRLVKTLGIRVVGVHMHNGSDILDADIFMAASDILFHVAESFLSDLEYLNFGSGFKVRYHKDDFETDMEEVGLKMSHAFRAFCRKHQKDLGLIFEPGKYLVSEAGTLFASVNLVKHTTSTVFVGLNTGLNHMIRPMFYDAWHDIVNISNPNGRLKIYTVVGNICETDTFGTNRRVKEVRQGDIIAIKNAGAYCASMASNYNSHCRPAEVLVIDGKTKVIHERESLEDLLKNQNIHLLNNLY